jgi:hypothetical protein
MLLVRTWSLKLLSGCDSKELNGLLAKRTTVTLSVTYPSTIRYAYSTPVYI